MMRTSRLVVSLVAMGLLAGACSGDADSDPTDIPTAVASRTTPPSPTPSPSPSATSAPSPTPAPTETATPLTPPASTEEPVDRDPAVLTRELAGVEYPTSGGSCPVGEVGASTIVDCAAVELLHGSFAVIVEEQADTRHIATLLRLDEEQDLWFPVKFSEHYGFTVPDSPWVSITLQPVQNLFSGDVILVEGFSGGSGAVTAWDIVGWPSADSVPSVIAAFPAVGQTSLRVAAGLAHQTTANYSDGAPNCCPTLHDLRIVNLAEGTSRTWEALPNDQISPMVAAFELYQRWLTDDKVGAGAYATSNAIDQLWPAPSFDVHQGIGTSCLPTPEHFQCTFQNEAGVRHFLVEPGGIHGYEVVGITNKAD